MKEKKRRKISNDSDSESENIDTKYNISVKNNKILFYSPINTTTCFKLIQCIDKAKMFLKHTFSDEPIYIHICSDGGHVYPVLSVIDTILNLDVNVVTINEGCVASAGVLLSLAGDVRCITKHSYMLIHEIRSGCWGTYSECVDDMDNNNILMKDMCDYINERCNNTLLKKDLKNILKHDKIWGAKKCLKYGLVDKIL